jgi:hypothetical protein
MIEISLVSLNVDYVFLIRFTNILFVLFSIGAITTLATLFLYKKRTLQIKLCKINLGVSFLYIIGLVALLLSITQNSNIKSSIQLSILIPFINIVLLFLAMKGMKKDDDLVKSIDRIR